MNWAILRAYEVRAARCSETGQQASVDRNKGDGKKKKDQKKVAERTEYVNDRTNRQTKRPKEAMATNGAPF